MTNPFKYGKLFDSTITRLILAIVVLLPWTIQFCHRTGTELHTERHALLSAGTLMTDSVGIGSVSLNRGDSITLLGVVDYTDAKQPMFWVQTDKGDRGYLPQACVADSAIVVSRSLNFSKDTTGYSANHNGDTIVVKSVTKKDKNSSSYNSLVRLASGKDTVLSGTPFIFCLADSLEQFTVATYGENMEPMSRGKFESLILGKRFDEIEQTLRPALVVGHTESGALQAQFPVLVFEEGEFFKPIVNFDADSIVTDYRMPTQAARSRNNWVLKYIPFYGKLCDLPMVGAIWSNGIYQETALPIEASNITKLDLNGFSMKTVGNFILFIAAVIYIILHALLVPMLLPWLLFGLLRFPFVYKRVNNSIMCYVLKAVTMVVVIAWIFVSLSNYYIILMLIGMAFVVNSFYGSVNHVLLETCPEIRCSICKTLYSTSFTERVEEGERQNAIEEVTEVLDTVITGVERWETYDEVTTTYGDGHTEKSRENVRQHRKEHGYNIVGVFMENVVYVPYTNYYTCAECGAQETSHDTERVVLKRTKLREYQSHF